MTSHHRRLLPLATFLAATLLLPSSILAFSANPVENLLENIFNRATPSEAALPRGEELLKQLDMQSNTEPRPFSAELSQLPALLTASMPLVFRLATGVFANGYQVSIIPKRSDRYTILTLFDKYQISETSTIPPQLQQRQPLILYDIESCPYCRKVREAVSILSLDVMFRPCPKDGYPWRREIKNTYGKDATFPFLVDPNTQAQMFNSDAILEYLFSTYGNGDIPTTLTPGNALVVASQVAGLLFRGGNGGTAKPSNPPSKPSLTLYSYEGSPFCKLVKEKLCELELEHLQISCPRGSANRQRMLEEQGRFQVPFLQDDNTGVELFESQAILEYLEKQYAVQTSPVKYM